MNSLPLLLRIKLVNYLCKLSNYNFKYIHILEVYI